MMMLKLLFTLFSIIIARADIKTGAVPRIAFVFAFPFFAVLIEQLPEGNRLPESAAGVFAGLLVFLFARAVSGRRLGLADVWYSALIGMVMGLRWWYAAVGSSCILGMGYMIFTKQRRIPFIPFMALGGLIMNIIQGWRL